MVIQRIFRCGGIAIFCHGSTILIRIILQIYISAQSIYGFFKTINHVPRTRNLMIPPSPSRRLCSLVLGADVLVRELEVSLAGSPPDRAVEDVRPVDGLKSIPNTLLSLTILIILLPPLYFPLFYSFLHHFRHSAIFPP